MESLSVSCFTMVYNLNKVCVSINIEKISTIITFHTIGIV